MKRANGGYRVSEMLGLFRGASGIGLALLESISEETYNLLPSILSAGLYDSSETERSPESADAAH
jgi:hypothetical protein